MTRIGLLSDTHSYLDPQIFRYFEDCDEVWHAGDIGSLELVDQLRAFKPLRGVSGNIDSKEIERECPIHQRFELEGLDIWITHIGGSPPRYNPFVRPNLQAKPPDLFICGHSHILKVKRDPTLNDLLFINPGAAGKSGFHQVRTCIRFSLDDRRVSGMEVIELGRR
ncbi:metallophosphoesterase family protein [Larkinella soli]|uniref:metallophosphoesterase family protein n=1 Tax=Larkinella soli TaxID=1770527 RepID=UPI000FFBEC7A|nr:metallophosphoesterase family protein [Larkinella soli]